jgi:integrase
MTYATVKLFLDTRQVKVVGNGIVKISVTFKRIQRLYSTGEKTSELIWTKLKRNVDENGISSKLRDSKFLEIYEKLYGQSSILQKAKLIAEKLGDNFTFEDFKYQLDMEGDDVIKDKELNTANAIKALMDKGFVMKEQDRVGNALNYELSAKSLARFVNSLTNDERYKLGLNIIKRQAVPHVSNTVLLFNQITVQFLEKYEQWMLRCGKISQKKDGIPTPASSTTVGLYLRHLRAVFNDAIEDGIVDSKLYPFRKKGYVIPEGKNIKKALKKTVVEQIMSFEAKPNSMEERSRDLWVFSYLCNGMNMTDICNRQWKDFNFEENTFKFIRIKTIKTKKANNIEISGVLFPQSLEIIKKWGNPSKNANDYIFPFIDDSMSALRKKEVIRQVIKVTNANMRKIAKKLEITGNVLTYSARHSFATILKKSNAPLSFIQSALGHRTLATTQLYTDSFEDEQVHGYLQALI